MKYYVALLAALMLSCSGSKNISSLDSPGNADRLDWIPFHWEPFSTGAKSFPKAAIYIPVTIPSLEDLPTVMQFDLGSDATMLYENPFKALGPEKDFFKPHWNRNVDSTYKFGRLKKYTFQMGSFPIKNPLLRVNYGEAFTRDSFTVRRKVGTIGSDVFAKKYLIIDFPKQRIAIKDTLSAETLDKFTFIQARVQDNRLEVPFEIEGVTYWFLFDTGASIFPVQTNKSLWDTLTGGVVTDSFKVPSWGKMVDVYGAPLKKTVKLGDKKLPSTMAYYLNTPEIYEYFNSIGVSGITGNAYFLKNTVIFDYKKKRFGILKN